MKEQFKEAEVELIKFSDELATSDPITSSEGLTSLIGTGEGGQNGPGTPGNEPPVIPWNNNGSKQ